MQPSESGILLIDAERRLLFADARAADILGYADAADLRHAWAGELQPLIGTLVDGKAGGGEIHQFRFPRSAEPLDLEVESLAENGSGGHLIRVRDPHYAAALQSELELAMQMRGLARLYSSFAHDLKAPLNAMVMTLELLKATVLSNQPAGTPAGDKCTRYVGNLNDEIQRVDRQLRVLLSQTGLSSPNEPQESDLRPVVTNLQSLLAPYAKHHRITLKVAVPDDPVTLAFNRDQLRQALFNVLLSSLAALPNGGELRMTMELVDGQVRVVVADDGCPLLPEPSEAVFDLAFSSKSTAGGVCLRVAREVARAHSGTFEAASNAGGNTYVISLPITRN